MPDGYAAYGSGSLVTAKRGSEVDVLHSIEKITLSSQEDTLTITAGTDLTGLTEIDGGANPDGTKDVLDARGYDKKLEIDKNTGHLIGDGIDIKLDNFERVELPSLGDDDGILVQYVSNSLGFSSSQRI